MFAFARREGPAVLLLHTVICRVRMDAGCSFTDGNREQPTAALRTLLPVPVTHPRALPGARRPVPTPPPPPERTAPALIAADISLTSQVSRRRKRQQWELLSPRGGGKAGVRAFPVPGPVTAGMFCRPSGRGVRVFHFPHLCFHFAFFLRFPSRFSLLAVAAVTPSSFAVKTLRQDDDAALQAGAGGDDLKTCAMFVLAQSSWCVTRHAACAGWIGKLGYLQIEFMRSTQQ